HFTMNAYAPGHLNGALTFVVQAGETAKRVDIETPAGETHSAPCDDADVRGYPVPMATLGAPSAAATDSASGGTTASKESAQSAGSAPPAGPDQTRAASFSGTGGGLP